MSGANIETAGWEEETENLHIFQDPQIGGVALALPHGSVLFEVRSNIIIIIIQNRAALIPRLDD